MDYIAIKSFPHDRLGQIQKGAPVPVTDKEGERLKLLGLVEYSTKVVRQVPAEPVPSASPSAAAGAPSSASPAAQASTPPTPTPSAPGETKPALKKAAKKTAGSKAATAE